MNRKSNRVRTTLFDPSRSILVQATPEEHVRQELVQILIEKMSVPLEAIKTEYPLNHLDSKTLMRADIVVWYRESRYDHDKPLIVFEVKAPNIEITDQTLDQVMSYQEILQCPFVGVSNGKQSMIYEVDPEGKIKLLAENIYSYEQFVGRNVIYATDALRMRRLSYNEVSYSKYLTYLIDNGYIGEDTPSSLQSFMADLQNVLMVEKMPDLPVSRYGITIKEDISYSYLTYGNAAGGKFTGYYRGFVVEDHEGNEQIYRLAVFGTGSMKDDPVFGNRKGSTVLFVTVDHHIHGAHNALQLNLDRSIVESKDNDLYNILHDGRMTINKGAIKKQELLDFVAASNDFLLNSNRINLGFLPFKRSITWADAEEFIFRVLLYTSIREKLRFKYSTKKKTKPRKQVIKKLLLD